MDDIRISFTNGLLLLCLEVGMERLLSTRHAGVTTSDSARRSLVRVWGVGGGQSSGEGIDAFAEGVEVVEVFLCLL